MSPPGPTGRFRGRTPRSCVPAILFLALLLPAPRVEASTFAVSSSDTVPVVGTRVWEWRDDTRPWRHVQGPGATRRMIVQAWYPGRLAPGATRAPRLPEHARLPRATSPRARALLAAPSASLLDAPLALPPSGPVGVLLMSHGLYQRRSDYQATAEALARAGFIVIGVDHPGGAASMLWRDGSVTPVDTLWEAMSPPHRTIEEYHTFTEERVADWARDLLHARALWLDSVARPAGLAADRFRWGALGHSNGGKAAALACSMEEALAACANLDGWPLPATVEVRGLAAAYLQIEDRRDVSTAELQRWNSDLLEYTRNMDRLTDRKIAMLRAMRGPALLVTLPGLRHPSFTDWPALDPALVPAGATRPPAEALAEVREYLRAFFSEQLLGRREPLLHPTAEVMYFDRSRWLSPP